MMMIINMFDPQSREKHFLMMIIIIIMFDPQSREKHFLMMIMIIIIMFDPQSREKHFLMMIIIMFIIIKKCYILWMDYACLPHHLSLQKKKKFKKFPTKKNTSFMRFEPTKKHHHMSQWNLLNQIANSSGSPDGGAWGDNYNNR